MDYKQSLNSEIETISKVTEYLEETEELIYKAFAEAKTLGSTSIEAHNNPLLKWLDALLRTLTFGFAHISTKTESVILESESSINNNTF